MSSKYSLYVQGEHWIYKYRKLSDNVTAFDLGPNILGTIHNMGRTGYSASCYQVNPKFPITVSGFKTRYRAADYLIRSFMDLIGEYYHE